MSKTSDRLKEAMRIRDMKQVDLLARTGINKGAMSSYLAGRYEPKQKNLHALARALSVSEAWLMGLDVPMEPTLPTPAAGSTLSKDQEELLYDFSAVYVHTDVVKDPAGKWVHKEMPKNASSIRRIVLPSEIIEEIGHGDPEEFVYGKTPTAITNAFDYLRKKLGLQCRFHDLRHYAASILHAIGMPDQYIMERGGWSTDGTLKAVYRNVLTDKNKVFTDKANEYFRGNILGTGNLHKENVSHEISHAVSEV